MRWLAPRPLIGNPAAILRRSPMMTFPELTESMIQSWHGIVPPNDPARRMAADLAAVITAFEAVRGRMRFEDEPASFEAALRECKE
jgi:hypothetical protein